jgi:hypothetical protein
MSQDVKRWTLIPLIEVAPDEHYVFDGERPDFEHKEIRVMPVTEHESIVAELKTDVARLCETVRYLESTNPQLTDAEKTIARQARELVKLKAQLKEANEVAKFYADEYIYDAYDNYGCGDISKATDDCGTKARAYLEKWKGEEP